MIYISRRTKMNFRIGKIDNINEILCINTFGIPPAGFDVKTKDDYVDLLTNQDKELHRYRTEDGYHIVKGVRHEHIVSGREGWDLDYRYNSDLFRCDHFKDTHDGLHVLFSGCSSTEGIGIKQEDTWAYKIYESLSRETRVDGYYNLGQSNTGYHQVINNILTYISKYGKPDMIFAILPNIQRRYEWDSEHETWRYVAYAQPNDSPDKYNCLDSDDYMNVFPVWVKIWNSFIVFCKSNDIKIFWSAWDMIDRMNIESSGIFSDTYIPIESVADAEIIKDRLEADGLSDKDIYARDNHPGPLANLIWSKNFLSGMKNLESHE
jgi:hypothetical protein